MKRRTDRQPEDAFLSAFRRVSRELASGRHGIPQGLPAIRALCRRVPWRLLLLWVGFVVQAGLVLMVWQLVDLCISLMEVWLQLARKHLELQLS